MQKCFKCSTMSNIEFFFFLTGSKPKPKQDLIYQFLQVIEEKLITCCNLPVKSAEIYSRMNREQSMEKITEQEALDRLQKTFGYSCRVGISTASEIIFIITNDSSLKKVNISLINKFSRYA